MKRTGLKIGTHSGSFHCDEALGVWMLKRLEEYKDAVVIRTRSEDVLATCDLILDVGGKYDPKTHRYDHHQRTFSDVMPGMSIFLPFFLVMVLLSGRNIRLSSAGLIYLHFGKRVLTAVLGEQSADDLEAIYQRVYVQFIEGVDGVDNGVTQYAPQDPNNKDVKVVPLYTLKTDLSARVGRLNQRWNDKSDYDSDKAFAKATELCGEEFMYFANDAAKSWLPARQIVAEAINKRFQCDESGEILVLPEYCPWEDHLFELEKKFNFEAKYLIWPDKEGWRIRAVPLKVGSFDNRLPLPEEWRGLRDEELDKVMGLNIPKAKFVHATGFIGGHSSYDGVIAMAKEALNKNKRRKKD